VVGANVSAAVDSGVGAATLGLGMDTRVVASVGRVTNASTWLFNLTVVVNGSAVPVEASNSSSFLQVRRR
jgi:hypothetical protein